jgi:hypothetical protein
MSLCLARRQMRALCGAFDESLYRLLQWSLLSNLQE